MRISDWSSDVCSSDLQREDYELQDIVERRCRSYAKVNATVRSPEIIQDLLKKGSSFYETVFDKGFLLYKNEGAELPFSVRPATPAARMLKAEKEWDIQIGSESCGESVCQCV